MSRSYTSASAKLENLQPFAPKTDNQGKAESTWDNGYNLVLSGSAGTGKTYLALRFALEQVLDKETEYEELVIVRSIVPTRDIGFLPGNEEEKKQAYAAPYVGLLKEIMGDNEAWNKLVTAKKLRFESTSFIRGTTFNNAIIVVDEMQNLNFHELDSVITRVGHQCRFIMCGDYYQSDFQKDNDKKGILNFMNIVSQLNQFDVVEFTWKDIVRSDFVRDYIMTKEMLGIK
jgi:phosphate starvation-inducible PhoH-like protein